MTDRAERERAHTDVGLAGFRAHATAIGLIQLIHELQAAGVLNGEAVGRVRAAIIDDLSLSKPLHADEADFRDRLRSRLDRLLQGG